MPRPITAKAPPPDIFADHEALQASTTTPAAPDIFADYDALQVATERPTSQPGEPPYPKGPETIEQQAARGLSPAPALPDLGALENEVFATTVEYEKLRGLDDVQAQVQAGRTVESLRKTNLDRTAPFSPFLTTEIGDVVKRNTAAGSIPYRAAEAIAPKTYGENTQAERAHYWRVATTPTDRELGRVIKQDLLQRAGVPKDEAAIRAQAAFELNAPLLIPTTENPDYSAGAQVDIGSAGPTELRGGLKQGAVDIGVGALETARDILNAAKVPVNVVTAGTRKAAEAVGLPDPAGIRAKADEFEAWSVGSPSDALLRVLPEGELKRRVESARERDAGMLAGQIEIDNAILNAVGMDPIDPQADGFMNALSRLALEKPREQIPQPAPTGESIASGTAKRLAGLPEHVTSGLEAIRSGERSAADVYAEGFVKGADVGLQPVMELFTAASKVPGAEQKESAVGWFMRVPATGLSAMATTQLARIADYMMVRAGAESQRRNRVPGNPEMTVYEAFAPVLFTGSGVHDYLTSLYNGDSFTSEWLRAADTASTLPDLDDETRASLRLQGGNAREVGTRIAMLADLMLPVDEAPLAAARAAALPVRAGVEFVGARGQGLDAKGAASVAGAATVPSITHRLMMSDPDYRAIWQEMEATDVAQQEQFLTDQGRPVDEAIRGLPTDTDAVRSASLRAYARRAIRDGFNPAARPEGIPREQTNIINRVREQLTTLRVRPEDIESAIRDIVEPPPEGPRTADPLPDAVADAMDAKAADAPDRPPLGAWPEDVFRAADVPARAAAARTTLAAHLDLAPEDPVVDNAIRAALSYYNKDGQFVRAPELTDEVIAGLPPTLFNRALDRLAGATPQQVMDNAASFEKGGLIRWSDQRVPDRARVKNEILAAGVAAGRPLTAQDVDAFLAVQDHVARTLTERGVIRSPDEWYAKQSYREMGGEYTHPTARGLIAVGGIGPAIIALARDANLSTLFHESAHLLRAILPESHMADLDAFVAEKYGGWTEKAEEWFARQFESVLRTGRLVLSKKDGVTPAWRDRILSALRYAADILSRAYADGLLPNPDPRFVAWMDTFLSLRVEPPAVTPDAPVAPPPRAKGRGVVEADFTIPAPGREGWTPEMLATVTVKAEEIRGIKNKKEQNRAIQDWLSAVHAELGEPTAIRAARHRLAGRFGMQVVDAMLAAGRRIAAEQPEAAPAPPAPPTPSTPTTPVSDPLVSISTATDNKTVISAVQAAAKLYGLEPAARAALVTEVKRALKEKVPYATVADIVAARVRPPTPLAPVTHPPTMPDALVPIPPPEPTTIPPTMQMPMNGTPDLDVYGEPRALNVGGRRVTYTISPVSLASLSPRPGVEVGDLSLAFSADELSPTGVDTGTGSPVVGDGEVLAGNRRVAALQDLYRRGMAGEEPYRSVLAGVQAESQALAARLGIRQPMGDEILMRVVAGDEADVKAIRDTDTAPASDLATLALLPTDIAQAATEAGGRTQAEIAAAAGALAAMGQRMAMDPDFAATSPIDAVRDGIRLYVASLSSDQPVAKTAAARRKRYIAVAGARTLPVSQPSVMVALRLEQFADAPEKFAAFIADAVADGWGATKDLADLPASHADAVEYARRLEMESIEHALAQQEVVTEPPGFIPTDDKGVLYQDRIEPPTVEEIDRSDRETWGHRDPNLRGRNREAFRQRAIDALLAGRQLDDGVVGRLGLQQDAQVVSTGRITAGEGVDFKARGEGSPPRHPLAGHTFDAVEYNPPEPGEVDGLAMLSLDGRMAGSARVPPGRLVEFFGRLMGGKLKEAVATNPGSAAYAEASEFRPSKVLYQRKVQTDTPEFRRWFGDSKVVDADGQPLVVYHGTDKVFDSFVAHENADVFTLDGKEIRRAMSWDMGDDRTGAPDAYHYTALERALAMGPEKALAFTEKEMAPYIGRPDADRLLADAKRLAVGGELRRTTEPRPSGDGAWFTPDPRYSFIANAGIREGGSVVPVYVSIKNPVYVDAAQIESAGRSYSMEKYKAQGYDGAIFAEDPKNLARSGWNGATQVVAFYPEQIKSAVANRGTFDPNNPSILLQHRDYTEAILPRTRAGQPAPPVPRGDVVAEAVARDETPQFSGANPDREGFATPYGIRIARARSIPYLTREPLNRSLGYKPDQMRYNARDLAERTFAYAIMQETQATAARSQYERVGNRIAVPVRRLAAVRARGLLVLGDIPKRVATAIENRRRLAPGESVDNLPIGLSADDASRIRTLLDSLDVTGWSDSLPRSIRRMTTDEIRNLLTVKQYNEIQGAVMDAQSGAAPFRGRVDRYAMAANVVWSLAQRPGGWFTPSPLERGAPAAQVAVNKARSAVGAFINSTAAYLLPSDQFAPDMRADIRPLYERLRREIGQLAARLAEDVESALEQTSKPGSPGAMNAVLARIADDLPGAVPPIGVLPNGDGQPSDLHRMRAWLYREPPQVYGTVGQPGGVYTYVPHDRPRVGDLGPGSPERPMVDAVSEVYAMQDVLLRVLNPPGRRMTPTTIELLESIRNRTLTPDDAGLVVGLSWAAIAAAKEIGVDVLVAAAGASGAKDKIAVVLSNLESGAYSGMALDAYDAFYRQRWVTPERDAPDASVEALVRTLGVAPKTIEAPFWVFDVLNRLNLRFKLEEFVDNAIDHDYVFDLTEMARAGGNAATSLRDRAMFAEEVRRAVNNEMWATSFIREQGVNAAGVIEVAFTGTVVSPEALGTARLIIAEMGIRPDVLAFQKGFKGDIAPPAVTGKWLALSDDPATRARELANPQTFRDAGALLGLHGRDIYISSVMAEHLAALVERHAPLAERLAAVVSNRDAYANLFAAVKDVFQQLKGAFITGGPNGILAAALFGASVYGGASVGMAAALSLFGWTWMITPRFPGFFNNTIGALAQGAIGLGYMGAARAFASKTPYYAGKAAYQTVRFHQLNKAVDAATAAVKSLAPGGKAPENVVITTKYGAVYSVADMVSLAERYGLDGTQARFEAAESVRRTMDRLYATYESDPSFTGTMFRQVAGFFGRYRLTENYRRVYELIDTFFRYVWLIRGIQDGMRPEDAVQRSLKIAFDYTNTSQMDRWVNTIGMFWMYQRRALDLTLWALVEHPHTVLGMLRAMRAQDLTSGYADINEDYERQSETVPEYAVGRAALGYLPAAGGRTVAQKLLLAETPQVTAIKIMADLSTADWMWGALSRSNPMIQTGFNVASMTAGGPVLSFYRREVADSPTDWRVPMQFVLMDQAINNGALSRQFHILPVEVKDPQKYPGPYMYQEFEVAPPGRMAWEMFRNLVPGFSTMLTSMDIADRGDTPVDEVSKEILAWMENPEEMALGRTRAVDTKPRPSLGRKYERARGLGITPAAVASPMETQNRVTKEAGRAMQEKIDANLEAVKRAGPTIPKARDLKGPPDIDPNKALGVDPAAPIGLQKGEPR